MKTLPLAMLVVSVAAASSIVTLVAQKQVQKSTVYPWSDADTKPNDWGAVRQVMRTPTPTLDELEIHISTLAPGKSPHAPHQHEHEELLILKEGTLETFQSGKTAPRRPRRDHLPVVERAPQRDERRHDAGDLFRDRVGFAGSEEMISRRAFLSDGGRCGRGWPLG